eukprot:TRINITY_DN364_c0_g1_i4.p1 TRINITY_DN364_c0_g1~~TRINITY_DN364_c0_g1_i4.p1  ORF type:complete len:140 (-),score=30.39 TRINITY_DN364_c0_g1_i4:71-490(-)
MLLKYFVKKNIHLINQLISILNFEQLNCNTINSSLNENIFEETNQQITNTDLDSNNSNLSANQSKVQYKIKIYKYNELSNKKMKIKYKKISKAKKTQSIDKNSNQTKKLCSICLEHYGQGEMLIQLDCNHHFHLSLIHI